MTLFVHTIQICIWSLCFYSTYGKSTLSPSLSSSMASNGSVSPTPSLDATSSSSIVEEMNSSPVQDCYVAPSTCICGGEGKMSIMSTSVNMTEQNQTVVSMMISSSMDSLGVESSYYTPMSSPSPSQPESTSAGLTCQCFGQHTICASVVSSTSTSTSEETTRGGGKGNGKNKETTLSSTSQESTSQESTSKASTSQASTSQASTSKASTSQASTSKASTTKASTSQASTSTTQASVSTSQAKQVVPTPTSTSVTASASQSVEQCENDCADVLCGSATTNQCGNCVGGTTGLSETHGLDCNNVCDGSARNDSCGKCTNPPANDQTGFDSPFADCSGTCDGTASVDSCGNCTGGTTGFVTDAWKDACGICGGDNSSCTGCDGVPNSGLVNDGCQVCGGDGSSCTTITSVTPNILPTTSEDSREVTVLGAGLNGDSIKCFFDGVESAGTVVGITSCKCTIPSGSVGGKTFTVQVVKGGADTETADLTITLYDPVATKIIGLSPTDLEINTAQALTVTLQNGLESGNAVATITTSTSSKKRSADPTTIPASYSESAYTVSLSSYPSSRKLTIALSLNGIHNLQSDVSLERTVFAPAPQAQSVIFSDTGARLNVAFDSNVDGTNLGTCAEIFDAATVASLGTNPVCSWSDMRQLMIEPGAGATIVPSDNIMFKPDVLKAHGESFSKTGSGQRAVSPPANPAQVNPVITGPSQISSCGNLTLDAGMSSGGGGRALSITWELVETSNSEIEAVLGAAADQAKVYIDGSLLTGGSSYTFKLTVENFLSSSAHVSTVVVKATTPVPEVSVQGPLNGEVLAKNDFYITASAEAASCSVDKALTFTWSATCTNDDSSDTADNRAESAAGYMATKNKAALKIDAGSLLGGKNYVFTVVVALTSSPDTKTTVTVNVAAQSSPLEPSIKGGDRTVGVDSGNVALDAKSTTIDPDNVEGSFSCAWSCLDITTQQPCVSSVSKQSIPFADQCEITVSAGDFESGKSYRMTSQISKGSRSGSASMVLTVVAGNPPAVSVLVASSKVSPGDKVRLEGTYTSSSEPTSVMWTCDQGDGYLFLDLTNAALISSSSNNYNADGTSVAATVLNANVLTTGGSYKCSLNVNDGNSVGSSSMVIEVRNGPSSGTLAVSSTSLQALDNLILTASLWVTDSDCYPLQYQFGYLKDGTIFQLWTAQSTSEYTLIAPPGYGANNALTLRLIIKDNCESTKSVDQVITVTPVVSVDEEQVEGLAASTVQTAEDTGNYQQAVPELGVLVIATSSATANFTKDLTNTTVKALISATESSVLDKGGAESIFNTYVLLEPTLLEDTTKVLDSFQRVIDTLKDDLDLPSIERGLEWLSQLKTDTNNTAVLQDAAQIYDDLATAVAGSVDLGQAAVEVTSENSPVTIKVAHSLLVGSMPSHSGSGAAIVDFGDQLRDNYQMYDCEPGKLCLGVVVKMVNYEQDLFTKISSNNPGIVANGIISIEIQNPETSETIPVTGLSKPITITFNTGTPTAGTAFVAYYYDNARGMWSKDGLTCTASDTTMACQTTHLTAFGFGPEADNSSSTQPTTPVVVDSIYSVSFLLSNTTWNDTFLNSSSPEFKALKDEILQGLQAVYSGDATLKNVLLVSLKESDGNTKAMLTMTFDGSNENALETLQESLKDGYLGSLSVDKDSLTFTDAYKQSESEDDDDTPLIIGTVFGVFFGLAIILLGAAWLKNRQSQRKVGNSNPSVTEGQPPEAAEAPEHETPA